MPRAAFTAVLLGVLAVLVARSGPPELEATQGGSGVEAAVAEAPLAFEPNASRTDPSVEFLASSVAGGSLHLTAREAVLSLPGEGQNTDILRLGLAGADPRAEIVGIDALPGRANSFIGDDPSRWRSGIVTYERVRYREIYPGIDLDFYGNQRDLEYDYRLAPGADPADIAVDVRGADSLRLTGRGDLLIGVGDTTVRQRAPVAYQPLAGERHRVEARYELDGSTVSFRLGAYDRSQPLVIDPLVLAYSTYLGGGGQEFADGIAIDSAGAAYVTGQTNSTDFPTQDQFAGDAAGGDVFVTKFNPDSGGAATLAYSTYIGGGADDFGRAIAVDSTGAAYVTGGTLSTNYPTQDPDQTDPGDATTDVIVTKLNPDAGGAVTLAYSTYLGGGAVDSGQAIAVDAEGEAYVTGTTGSTDYPTNAEFQTNQPGDDVFVTKLNADTGGPVTREWSTYLGGGSSDLGFSIAVQSSDGVSTLDAAYVTGRTESANYPTQDAFQADQADTDAFVTKIVLGLFAGNVTLPYSTYVGGGGSDLGLGVAVDSSGAAYLAGSTSSGNFPVVDPFQGALLGSQDGYVTKLNPDTGGAVTLAYSTYLGGDTFDVANAIAVDAGGSAHVAGLTDSANFPIQDAFDTAVAGTDFFVAKLGPDPGGPPTLEYATYLGGSGSESSPAIAVDSAGHAFVNGGTPSADYPTQDAFQADQADTDTFVTMLDLVPDSPPSGDADSPETTITKGPKKKTKKKKATFEFASDEPGSTFECKLDKGGFAPCLPPSVVKAKKKGKHSFEVRAIDAAGNVDATPATQTWKRKKKRKKK